jgi:predicted glycogen debranching enzyme
MSGAIVDDSREWLEADGMGGFASGPVVGPRTRRYHALLLATTLGGRRYVLVNGLEVVATTPGGRFPVLAQGFAGGVVTPGALVTAFSADPWPRWQLRLPDGTELEHEVLVGHMGGPTVLSFHLVAAAGPVVLSLRPLFSGRDYHALHHENPAFAFAPTRDGDRCTFAPYEGVPEIVVASNGSFAAEPLWYRRFEYREELARGFPGWEDLAAPGSYSHVLSPAHHETHEALLLLAAAGWDVTPVLPAPTVDAAAWVAEVRATERTRRAGFLTPVERAADAYFVRHQGGTTLVAGYPWFTDWGRDTFIALRGLGLATGRHKVVGEVLLRWAGEISDGMLPNRFRELGEAPEFNAVDAALWFVVVAFEYLHREPRARERPDLLAAIAAILDGHLRGTRHNIAAGRDGLLAAGAPGQQLTWMDAKIGDHVVTPRSGKPVEIQALWLNALACAVELGVARADVYRQVLARGRASFTARFWNEALGRLYDVVDVDHRPGVVDARLRPNQIFAVGGLPFALLEGAQARAVVDAVEAALVVPLGLRTLAREDPAYCPHYRGDPGARDCAYHQGTVWPWLMGPFVEAWLRAHAHEPGAVEVARARFVAPLAAHLGDAGVGHVSEIADGEPPHRPGGCPFQAWSLGELLRLQRIVLPNAGNARAWPA